MYQRLFLTLAGLSMLAGCGGGGSGSSLTVTYTGATTQAVVTVSNAKALSADAYSGSQLSSAVSGVGKEANISSVQSAPLQETSGLLQQCVMAVAGSKTSAKNVAATAQGTIQGYSGSFSYFVNKNQVSGAVSGTISFSQYASTATSAILNGFIDFYGTGTFSGLYGPDAGSINDSLTITISNLTGTIAGQSFSLTGSVAYSVGNATKIVNMSIVLTDNISKRTYWLKDYIQTLAGNSLTIAGNYYDPVHGYVVISTVSPLTVSAVDAAPVSGQLLFTGRNNTKARLSFNNGGHTVEADIGNGVYVVVQ